MRTTKYFKVTAAIAQRAGVAQVRYRTADNMMIISEQDIRAVRLQPEEYLTGVVAAVLTKEEATVLIAKAGKLLGPPPAAETEAPSPEEETMQEEVIQPAEEEATSEDEGTNESENESTNESTNNMEEIDNE